MLFGGLQAVAGSASADFQGISFTETSTANGNSYDIYADVLAGDQLNAVYGDDSIALFISSDSGFYNHPGGGATVANQTDFMLGIFPSLVDELNYKNTGETRLAINYGGFVPILINAINEQQVMIEELQSKVDEIEVLKQEIQMIKNMINN